MNAAFVFGMYKSDAVEAHDIWSGSDVEHSSSTVDCNRIMFRPQRSPLRTSFVCDKDLRGRKVVLLQCTLLCEMLDITT